MTTDHDKMLTDAIEHLKLVDDRDREGAVQQFLPAPLSDAMLLAGVLLATRRELAVIGRQVVNLADRAARDRETLAETRRLVDALAGPVTVGPATLQFRSPDGQYTRTVTVDPRPIGPAMADGQATADAAWRAATEPHRCDDCGNTRWIPLGARRCLKCQERDKLRAALASAIRYAREYHAAAFGGDCDPAELAHLAELEKLL